MRKQYKRQKTFHTDVSKWHSSNKFKVYNFDSIIISCGYKQITRNQVESCRKILSRLVRRIKPRPSFKMFFNFNVVLTKKSLGARMGRGKGNIKGYICKIVKNDVLFGLNRCHRIIATAALHKIKNKLPFKLKLLHLYKNGYCGDEDRCRR